MSPNPAPTGPYPRPDYETLTRYIPDRTPVPVDLSDNTNLWGMHPAAVEVLRQADPAVLSRYPSPYADTLREVAARRYGTTPDQVTTGAGSDGVLNNLWRAIAEQGGTVRYAGPTFSMIAPFCTMNGRVGIEVPWSEALADPTTLTAGNPVLIYVCTPNNPSGLQPERGWIDALFDATGNDGPVLVFDEAYAEYAGETLIDRAIEHPRALVTRTLSKAHGLAGMRVGLAFGSDQLIGEIDKSRGPYMVGRLSELMAAAAIADESGWLDDVVAQTLAHRDRLQTELARRGVPVVPSSANFIFVPVPSGEAKARSDALRVHGVSVRPFADCGELGDGLRVTVGPWDMMERFLEAWDQL